MNDHSCHPDSFKERAGVFNSLSYLLLLGKMWGYQCRMSCFDPEIIFRTSQDHNLGTQPGQLAIGSGNCRLLSAPLFNWRYCVVGKIRLCWVLKYHIMFIFRFIFYFYYFYFLPKITSSIKVKGFWYTEGSASNGVIQSLTCIPVDTQTFLSFTEARRAII